MTPQAEALVIAHIPLARKIASRFKARDKSDIIGYGMLGLVKAADRFASKVAPERFGAYAQVRIHFEIIDGYYRTGIRKRGYRGKSGTSPLRQYRAERHYSAEQPASECAIDVPDVWRMRAPSGVDLRAIDLSWLIERAPLDTRERFVCQRCLDGQFQHEIAQELGCSNTRVNQIRAAAIQKIRTFMSTSTVPAKGAAR
jgi:RNA polymerase sigma factor (sigma-70 family)